VRVDLVINRLDAAEDAAVEGGRRLDGELPGMVEAGDAGGALLIESTRAGDLVGHQAAEGIIHHPAGDLLLIVPEGGDLVLREIDAPHRGVRADIAQDVRQLHRDAKGRRVLQRLRRAIVTEDRRAEEADRARHAVAIPP